MVFSMFRYSRETPITVFELGAAKAHLSAFCKFARRLNALVRRMSPSTGRIVAPRRLLDGRSGPFTF